MKVVLMIVMFLNGQAAGHFEAAFDTLDECVTTFNEEVKNNPQMNPEGSTVHAVCATDDTVKVLQ